MQAHLALINQSKSLSIVFSRCTSTLIELLLAVRVWVKEGEAPSDHQNEREDQEADLVKPFSESELEGNTRHLDAENLVSKGECLFGEGCSTTYLICNIPCKHHVYLDWTYNRCTALEQSSRQTYNAEVHPTPNPIRQFPSINFVFP